MSRSPSAVECNAVEPDRRNWLLPVGAGVIAAIGSLGRLWLTNHEVLHQVLWAEDGLFPMCVTQSGFLGCTFEPFAGYLLFGPRVVAGVVSALPLSAWSVAANLAAALVAGAVGAAVAWRLRATGFSRLASVVVGLLPVVLPLVGLEAINTVGSMYMPMLFWAAIAVCLPGSAVRATWPVAIGLVVTALTIPSVVVLAPVILLELARRWIPLRQGLIWIGAIAIGLVPQFVVVLTAEQRRSTSVTFEAMLAWADATSISLSSLVPGVQIQQVVPSFDALEIHGWAYVGVYLTMAIALVGIIGYLRARTPVAGQLSLLVIAGLIGGFIPAATGHPNNRYYVIPLLCWAAAALLALDERARRSQNRWLMPAVIAVLALLWWPAFPASAYRATSGPDWSGQVVKAQAVCGIKPAGSVPFLFNPTWPRTEAGEPIPTVLPCTTVKVK